jgi:hypothetical protein
MFVTSVTYEVVYLSNYKRTLLLTLLDDGFIFVTMKQELNTEKVVGVLKALGLVAKISRRDYTRPGYRVRKINAFSVGIIFDSMGNAGVAASIQSRAALTDAGFAAEVQADNQTLVVRNA